MAIGFGHDAVANIDGILGVGGASSAVILLAIGLHPPSTIDRYEKRIETKGRRGRLCREQCKKWVRGNRRNMMRTGNELTDSHLNTLSPLTRWDR